MRVHCPCRICKGNAATREKSIVDGVVWYSASCVRCGEYRYQYGLFGGRDDAHFDVRSPYDDRLFAFLAAHIRQANSAGVHTVLLDGDWRVHAESHATTPVPKKLVKLLT